jgi:Peptidase C39 family
MRRPRERGQLADQTRLPGNAPYQLYHEWNFGSEVPTAGAGALFHHRLQAGLSIGAAPREGHLKTACHSYKRSRIVLPGRLTEGANRTMAASRIRRVVQEDETDCGIACIATLTGRSYHYVARLIRRRVLRKTNGVAYTRHRDLQRALRLMGFRSLKVWFHTWRTVHSPAIVPTRRTLDRRYWHWVVLRGDGRARRLIDPAPGSRRLVHDFRGYRARGYYIAVSPRRGAPVLP